MYKFLSRRYWRLGVGQREDPKMASPGFGPWSKPKWAPRYVPRQKPAPKAKAPGQAIGFFTEEQSVQCPEGGSQGEWALHLLQSHGTQGTDTRRSSCLGKMGILERTAVDAYIRMCFVRRLPVRPHARTIFKAFNKC